MFVSSMVAYVIAVIGKLLGTISYLFMKVANHKLEEKKLKGQNPSVYCSCTWIIGFVCLFAGQIFNLVALPFVGLVLFSTTVAIGIVFNNIIAMRYLGEKLVWKYDFPAFVLVVTGCTAIILLYRQNNEELTPQYIHD